MPSRRPPSAAARAPAAPLTSETIPDDLVEVGRVADAYGVHGWVRIAPHEHASESVLRGARRCWIQSQGAATPQAIAVESMRVHSAALVARLAGCADRDAALGLKGAAVFLPRADFPAAADDEYYWVDLIGCDVFDRAGSALGTVDAVDDHGAHAILRVRDAAPGGEEMLIPFVADYIVSVELAERRIVTDWQRDW